MVGRLRTVMLASLVVGLLLAVMTPIPSDVAARRDAVLGTAAVFWQAAPMVERLATVAAVDGEQRLAQPATGVCPPGEVDRFRDCRTGVYFWNLRERDPLTGPIIGTVQADFTIFERLDPATREWSAGFSARFYNLTGVATRGATASVIAECRGDCTGPGGPIQPNTPVAENVVMQGVDIKFLSPSPATATSRQAINLYVFHPAAVGSGTTQGSPGTELGPVRCDDGTLNGRGALARPGCVMVDFTPTFSLNSVEFSGAPTPLHNQFVADAQELEQTAGWGRFGSGKPLVRQFLADERAQRLKRAQVCPRSWPREPSPPGTLPELRDSCDEYPYSSTVQGIPRYAVTGHVPLGENARAGQKLSEFYRLYHILDGDAFYVDPT